MWKGMKTFMIYNICFHLSVKLFLKKISTSFPHIFAVMPYFWSGWRSESRIRKAQDKNRSYPLKDNNGTYRIGLLLELNGLMCTCGKMSTGALTKQCLTYFKSSRGQFCIIIIIIIIIIRMAFSQQILISFFLRSSWVLLPLSTHSCF